MMKDDDKVESFIEDLMYGFTLGSSHSEKDIMIDALRDQKFAERWANDIVKRGYSVGKNQRPKT